VSMRHDGVPSTPWQSNPSLLALETRKFWTSLNRCPRCGRLAGGR
jgi:hypothetical protein